MLSVKSYGADLYTLLAQGVKVESDKKIFVIATSTAANQQTPSTSSGSGVQVTTPVKFTLSPFQGEAKTIHISGGFWGSKPRPTSLYITSRAYEDFIFVNLYEALDSNVGSVTAPLPRETGFEEDQKIKFGSAISQGNREYLALGVYCPEIFEYLDDNAEYFTDNTITSSKSKAAKANLAINTLDGRKHVYAQLPNAGQFLPTNIYFENNNIYLRTNGITDNKIGTVSEGNILILHNSDFNEHWGEVKIYYPTLYNLINGAIVDGTNVLYKEAATNYVNNLILSIKDSAPSILGFDDNARTDDIYYSWDSASNMWTWRYSTESKWKTVATDPDDSGNVNNVPFVRSLLALYKPTKDPLAKTKGISLLVNRVMENKEPGSKLIAGKIAQGFTTMGYATLKEPKVSFYFAGSTPVFKVERGTYVGGPGEGGMPPAEIIYFKFSNGLWYWAVGAPSDWKDVNSGVTDRESQTAISLYPAKNIPQNTAIIKKLQGITDFNEGALRIFYVKS
jgi:hypothetical protein